MGLGVERHALFYIRFLDWSIKRIRLCVWTQNGQRCDSGMLITDKGRGAGSWRVTEVTWRTSPSAHACWPSFLLNPFTYQLQLLENPCKKVGGGCLLSFSYSVLASVQLPAPERVCVFLGTLAFTLCVSVRDTYLGAALVMSSQPVK